MVAPAVEHLSVERAGRLKVVKVNVDIAQQIVLAATLFAHGPAPLGDHGSATVREDAHQT
jgi:hypothetical protein